MKNRPYRNQGYPAEDKDIKLHLELVSLKWISFWGLPLLFEFPWELNNINSPQGEPS